MPIDRNSAQYITGTVYKPTQTSAPGVWDLDDQANNLAKNLWPLPPQAVQRSLRFNSADSAYLNRTFSANGNFQSFTVSCWVKRSAFGASNPIFVAGTDTADYMFITFTGADLLNFTTGENGTTNLNLVNTTAVFRDTSAWYHIVVAIDFANGTSTDRIKIYVNGTRQALTGTFASTAFTGTRHNRSGIAHYIGRWMNGSSYFNGYIAEFYFVDGLTLDPTSFGETDQQTGVWIPKRYVGTYGTNGFRLSFANNSSTTALGYDSSGQGNNWTPNNFSVTPGAGNDVLLDVPSLYGTDTGLGGEVLGNYCTLNPLRVTTATLTNGNLEASIGNAATKVLATLGMSSGKWYWEFSFTNIAGDAACGIATGNSSSTAHVGNDADSWSYRADGLKGNNFVTTAYGATWTTNDIIGVSFDADAGSLSFYKNGVSQGVAFTGLTSAPYFPAFGDNAAGASSTLWTNFGQRPFAYPAPAGYKALCTTNLPAPAIGQTSSNQADNHFAAVTYTGNGGTQTISTLDFQPDLVWIKRRDSNWSHAVYDSIRGAGSLKALSTNSADAEGVFNADTTYGYLSSFNNNGFTVLNGSTGGYTNLNNATYVAWCWNAGGTTATNTSGTITSQVRANQRAGFSIVTYTGTGANATVGHGLGITPSMIILKNRFSSAQGWTIWFTGFTANEYLVLNSTAAKATYSGQWSALPTATTIGLSSEVWTNGSGNSMVGYCWAAIPGYSAFGSYTGNGSSDGPFVYLGFRPRWLLVKNITFSPTNWILHDSARALTNPDGNLLLPDQSGAEAINSSVDYIDFLANGFKVRGNGEAQNRSGSTHIYAAFAETPARLSTAR